jgi:hypothetical protein
MPYAVKEEMVLTFTDGRTDSLRAMTAAEFQMMLASMEGAVKNMSTASDAEADKWRKRVMAAIGAWHRSRGYKEGKDAIVATALRACAGEYSSFNKIPLNKLRGIYAEFANKGKIAANVEVIEKKRLNGLYQEAVDGEEYEQAAEYKRIMDNGYWIIILTICKFIIHYPVVFHIG